MKIRFFASEKTREQELAANFAKGASKFDRCEIVPTCADPDLSGIDVAIMIGVKSRKMWQACKAAGVVPVMFDKGYSRERREGARVWEYWRVSIGEHHPTAFLDGKFPGDRLVKLDWDAKRWRHDGFQIVIAGSSAKYHDFYDLPDPTTWATDVVRQIRKLSDRPIIYRPKPSWDGAVPIPGTHFSGPNHSLDSALTNAWCVVTHGSNACFEAALAGIPSIVLGNAVARPISSTSIKDINNPIMGERGNWLKQLSFWQWTEREMARGEAWAFLRPRVMEMVQKEKRQ